MEKLGHLAVRFQLPLDQIFPRIKNKKIHLFVVGYYTVGILYIICIGISPIQHIWDLANNIFLLFFSSQIRL